MRAICCILLLSFFINPLFAQVSNSVSIDPNLKIYAVVVGISAYDPAGNIPPLKYAHRDAQEFAAFLQSPSGGSVPKENIRLLVNENATVSAIYLSLKWLADTSKRNAKVYFYFAGHGDKESETIANLGYLLTYNTPRFNYINNALRIEDLNDYANTLSIINNDKVILITDACHSGELAGKGFGGTYLVGDALRTVKNNEVRITSCGPNELSAEDKSWGGGRGVFSWYLVNGLNGAADRDRDGAVSLKDIQLYLDSCFSHDRTLAAIVPRQSQTPVVKGDDNFRLAKVDMSVSHSRVLPPTSPFSSQIFKALPESPEAYFFRTLRQQPLENLIDFTQLAGVPATELPLKFINSAMTKLVLPENRNSGSPTNRGVFDTLRSLINSIKDDQDKLQRFNERLVETLHNRAQDIINLYLDGDLAELEKREYYNSKGKGYEFLPIMMSVALKLIAPQTPLHRIMEVDRLYFTSVVERLRIPLVTDPGPLIDSALNAIAMAFGVESDHGAYLYNELGILYVMKKDYRRAEENLSLATQIAPRWAIPWSNLLYLYTVTDQFDKAMHAANIARSLQPGYQGTFVNESILEQKKGNLLATEELLRKSIRINSRHYLPFESLGYLFINTTQYKLADDYLGKAIDRKKDYHVKGENQYFNAYDFGGQLRSGAPCNIDPGSISEDNIMARVVLGVSSSAKNQYHTPDYTLSEKYFKQALQYDQTNAIAWHSLAGLLDDQHRSQEAEAAYLKAIQYHMGTAAFTRYCDSMGALTKFKINAECIQSEFQELYYDDKRDEYALAAIYEARSNYSKAEIIYRKLINGPLNELKAWKLLALMLEKNKRYKEAEELLHGYTTLSKNEKLLTAFYYRMIGRYPDSPEWYYTAGQYFYDFANKQVNTADGNLNEVDKEGIITEIDATKLFTDTSYYGLVAPSYLQHAIIFLNQAANLSQQDENALAEICFKLGELHTWAGLPDKAILYYKRSLHMDVANAATRTRLAEALIQSSRLGEAREQLDSLFMRHEIDFPKEKLLTTYYIHSGKFPKADSLLQDLKSKMILKDTAITELEARMQLLSNHPKQALPLYMEFLSLKPGDASTMYSIARVQAQLKDTISAWKWLESALNKGFAYPHVLAADPTWMTYRNSPKWKELQGRYAVMNESIMVPKKD